MGVWVWLHKGCGQGGKTTCISHIRTYMHAHTNILNSTPPPLQYPEHHLVGFPDIDTKFRGIGAPLRKAVDIREEYLFSLHHFKEVCGYDGNVGVVECIKKMCIRAKASDITLNVNVDGEVRMCVHV